MKWCAGSALLGPGSLGNGRLSERLRPLRTSRAAAARLAGVTRFNAPIWSSLPQRPQLRRWRIQPRTSCSEGSARSGIVASEQEVLGRSEEHTSELQSLTNLVCRLLLEKKKTERPKWTPM